MSKIIREVWVIREDKLPAGEKRARLFWSNEWGWVTPEEVTVFSVEERNKFDAPMNGKWVKATLTIG